MAKSTFIYVVYIKAAPERIWKALLDGEFTRQYWAGENVSDWQPGSPWEHRRTDATRSVAVIGEVVEAIVPTRLVLTWADPSDRGNRARYSRVTLDLKAIGDMVELSVTHGDLDDTTPMAGAIAVGWPRVLSSLKSLLETGRALDTWARA